MQTERARLSEVRAEEPPPMRGLEAWLRRPTRRLALALGFVALATALNSIGSIELRQERGFGPDVPDILATQALNWALLVALATPIGYAAVHLGRARSGAVVGAGLFTASLAVAAVLFQQQTLTERWMRGPERTERAERTGRPDPTRQDYARTPPEAPARPAAGTEPVGGAPLGTEELEDRGAAPRFGGRGGRGGRGFPNTSSLAWNLRFRMPRVLLSTWAFVGLGAAVRLFLDARERERDARRLELRAHALEGELAGAQLDALRAQLHPHFLFNALHSIGGLVRGGRGDEAVRTLDALGGLLRSGLESRGNTLVTLDEELALLDHYLAVERVRLGARLRVALDVEAASREAEVPPFLLQPLVENAVRYAVAERAEGGAVRVTARVDGATLRLDVEDDGPGFSPAVLAGEGWGIGLANVRARLATLFEGEGRLELGRSELGGARVRLTLPRDEEAPAS